MHLPIKAWLTTRKADWCSMFVFLNPSDVNPFSATGPVEHKRMKRNMAPTSSMSALLDMEPLVDLNLTLFLQRLDGAAVSPKTLLSERGPPVGLARWLAWLAADIIGEMSFSRRLGFLDTMSDVEDFFNTVESLLAYTSAVAVVPTMHKLLLGNPIIPYLINIPSLVITDIKNEEIQKRLEKANDTRANIMDMIIESQKTTPPPPRD